MKKLCERGEKLEKLVEKLQKMQRTSRQKHDAKMVTYEEKIIDLAKQGYNCQSIGENKWLSRK